MSTLLADTPFTRTTFEWGRIQSNSDWVLPIAVCLLLMLFVRQMYCRDARELGTAASWLLTSLRTLAFYGLLVLYLQPQWRTEQEVTRNSRVLVLADTSLSMGLTDVAEPHSPGSVSRARAVAGVLQDSSLLRRLRETHDVVVLRFDQELSRIASLGKMGATGDLRPLTPGPSPTRGEGRNVLTPGPSPTRGEGRNVLTPGPAPGTTSVVRGEGSDEGPSIDWGRALAPRGVETRLGQALRQALHDEQTSPLAGIVVFSDGGQNAGVAPDAAIQAAREAKIPLFVVGVGSDKQPESVRISDLAAPPRAFPGDRYTVTGYLQSQKMAGRVVNVQLLSREAGGENEKNTGPGQVEATERVTLGGDGEVVPVKFEITPDKVGRRTLTLRVDTPGGSARPGDAQREADVEIVDQKNRVLLFAGGPSREYQFLRSLLFRDRSTTVDVLLETAQPGISQDAAKILDNFPARREEMFAYDCVVALDPDWQALTAAQVDLLEKWVAEQGGGLVVAAGAVFAGKTIDSWTQDPQMSKIRGLYPVEFERAVAVLDNSTFAAKDPWPLDFTREGLDAEYLWIDDSAVASQQAWQSFPGVYSFQTVRGPKPSAAVLARFSDPRAAAVGQDPVYFASQFYGSGRVFYMGSAEMWRLRRVEEPYFEKFYTKLIRHVSQGRLLRGSNRGALLVGQDQGYLVGGTVQVRAQLTNSRLEPLEAPSVPLQVFGPERLVQTVVLRADPSRAGTFVGHFTAGREGTYRLELTIPESDDQRLTRRVQVRVPDLELESPQRNDALLSRIAAQTGGRYYVGTEAAAAVDAPDSIPHRLKDCSKTIILTAAPDHQWELTWMGWLMGGMCGLLCLEWLIRRLWKLA